MTTETTERLEDIEKRDPFAPHDLGCRCYPHVSQRAALFAASDIALREYRSKIAAAPPQAVPVERLRSFFAEHGWAIWMDEREGQPLDPWAVLAALRETP